MLGSCAMQTSQAGTSMLVLLKMGAAIYIPSSTVKMVSILLVVEEGELWSIACVVTVSYH